MSIWLGAVPAGQILKKLTANKNMQYVLFWQQYNFSACRIENVTRPRKTNK